MGHITPFLNTGIAFNGDRTIQERNWLQGIGVDSPVKPGNDPGVGSAVTERGHFHFLCIDRLDRTIQEVVGWRIFYLGSPVPLVKPEGRLAGE